MSALLIGGTAVAPADAAAASVGGICYGALPSQAYDTLDLIDSGGPFPYSRDGAVFQNREGVLPAQSTGCYHEYPFWSLFHRICAGQVGRSNLGG